MSMIYLYFFQMKTVVMIRMVGVVTCVDRRHLERPAFVQSAINYSSTRPVLVRVVQIIVKNIALIAFSNVSNVAA